MKRTLRLITILIVNFLSVFLIHGQYEYPFQNPELPAEERIDNLLSLMTLDEKVVCLSTDASVPRLGVKGTRHVEGLHGLAQGGPSNWGSRNPTATTIFPQAYGLGETWDRESIKRVAELEGFETRFLFQNENYKRGGLVVRAPNADLGRDPRWGRTEECYGEDPFLAAELTVSFVKGLQGDHPRYWRTASLMKHFLANSNENGRDSSSSDFDERLWREYYSYPFFKGVTKGGSRAYMAAYNSYNGIPCTVHPMLKNITVNEWGQDGIICTDGGAFTMLVSRHKYYPDLYKAAAACLQAGINQFLDRYVEGVYGALANGYVSEADLDSVLRGNFRVMIKLGMLDPPEMVPYNAIGVADTAAPWWSEKHRKAALEVTQKSIVLLKNENKTLPLNSKKIKSIAVIGPRADEVLLDWYSGTPPYTVSPLEGITKKAGEKIKINYAKSNAGDSAVNIARDADVVIVVVGNHPTCNGAGWAECPTPSFGREAVDRKSLTLEQEELVKQVYAVNKNTIMVLISNFPYAINWSQENIPAILHMANNSQELGNALADVLFGDYNPGGRLNQTWPSSMEQLPEMMDYNIRNRRTYMYFTEKPLYAFGYGLSYSTFDYSGMKVNTSNIKTEGTIDVSVKISNTGKYAGDEVVQLYVNHLDSKVQRPNIELKGFERVFLDRGETKTVQLTLLLEDLAYWDVEKHQFIVEKDTVNIMLGASSKDIKLQQSVSIMR
ncbi:MAG: glycoside hydrolase family 3 C-terminal domain-containing protein [Bacteroidales bacterium]|nr:glycoside hydrolase family 3 C-terminal domain-containing protein [Bacteroidales bacterium]